MGRKTIFRFLSEHEIYRIVKVIGEREKITDGEIRIALREKRHWGEGKLTLHQLALKEFHRLGIQKTKKRNGILIFLLISERKFHIIADRGIHTKVEDSTWDEIAQQMSAHFREGKFCDGLCATINAVGEILTKHFPADVDNRNELPDDISIS